MEDKDGNSFAAKVRVKESKDSNFEFMTRLSTGLTIWHKLKDSGIKFLVPSLVWLLQTPSVMYAVVCYILSFTWTNDSSILWSC